MTIRVILVSVLLAISSIAFAAIKDLSQSDWTNVLGEIGAQADAPLIERLMRSGKTLDKINSQTRGSLRTEEWINIFLKLNLEPKTDMQGKDWDAFFVKLGINAKAEVTAGSEQSAILPPTDETQEPPVQQASRPIETASTVTPTTIPPVQDQSLQAPLEQPIKPARISLDLRGTDILSVLKMISQKSDLNIIAGSNVRGSVTIYLKDVDSIDALKMILEMNSLAYVYEDKVIKVMTAQDYEAIYGNKFYDRTTTEIIILNYAKADNVLRTLNSVKSKIGQIIADAPSNALIIIDTRSNINVLKNMIKTLDIKTETKVISPNYLKVKEIADKINPLLNPNIGDLQIDERSNQLIITDTAKKVLEICQIIASLDKRHREVLIEARIVQLTHDDNTKIGVSWESIFNQVNDKKISGRVVGNLQNLSSKLVPLGASGIQLSVGTLEIDNFNAVFDLMQTVGKTDLVSTPRIAAIENKEARILVGTKEAYITTQVTNPGSTTANSIVAESVNFVDVGMKLFVTPAIGDDGFITMKIRPEVSSVDRILRTSQNNPIPIVRTSESETTAMVKDGITIVIAGLMEEKEVKNEAGVPYLCRIPLIGTFFSKTETQKVKTELIVFLTPHIMTGEVPSDEIKKKL